MAVGSFCVSIDVERAWGIWDKPSPEYWRRCLEAEQRIVERLIQVFDRYEVAGTWAVVGRLMDRDVTRPGEPALWFAPECVDAIRAARCPQEIGSHSYEHVYYGEIDRETAMRDLASARRVHATRNLEWTSFVFPRNGVAHLDVLAAQGLKVFRSVDHGLHMSVRRRFGHTAGRVANLVDKLLPLPPVAVEPIVHANGLVEIPTSMLLMSRQGMRRAVHPRILELKAFQGLGAAVRTSNVFHLWFHPSNFYYETDTQFRIFENILRRVRTLREAGKLQSRTMGSFSRGTPESGIRG